MCFRTKNTFLYTLINRAGKSIISADVFSTVFSPYNIRLNSIRRMQILWYVHFILKHRGLVVKNLWTVTFKYVRLYTYHFKIKTYNICLFIQFTQIYATHVKSIFD